MNAVPAATLFGLLCLLSLAGCGGDGPRADVQLGDRSATVPETTVVAALGDSITAGTPLWDPNPDVRAVLGVQPDPRSQWEYWAARRLPNTRFRNCGVNGERTDQIAARLEGCARDARVLVVQGGINDIAQMRRVRTAARNLRDIVVRGKRMKLRVALVEVLPWNNGYPGANHRIRRLNREIHAIGREEHVPVFPWYGRLEDPAAPGRMRTALTIDGNHPSVEGHQLLARDVRLP